MKIQFPNVNQANEDGLLAVGGNLEVQNLIEAYSNGIFPWPVEDNYPLTWFAPDPRGVICLEDIKFSRSLEKFVKKTDLTVRFNYNFKEIITECAQTKRKHESGTWIYNNIIQGYSRLFDAKKAYCVGVYQDEDLVGGLYGVCLGELISGESMFYKVDNASKLALYYLLKRIQERKIPFIDTQMVTPIIESFGGKNITRDRFMQLLSSVDKTIPREIVF